MFLVCPNGMFTSEPPLRMVLMSMHRCPRTSSLHLMFVLALSALGTKSLGFRRRLRTLLRCLDQL
jgi:hypothetical protein